MSQHDYNLANQSGANFRSDLNNALGAVQSNNSSTIAPSATVSYMWYAESSTTAMKVRNAGDTAFINVFKMTASTVMPYIQSSAGVSSLGSSITQRTENNAWQKSQRGVIKSVAYTSTVTLDMNQANNYQVSTLTGNLTIANPSAITAAPGQGGSVWLTQDGTGSRTVSFGSMWKFAAGTAPTATTTAAAVDRVDYMVRNASTIDSVYSLDVK
tara:strand:+ start:426 stop:1064 length:639 start_codon:yes stop_codon:yes gene_type:complete